jgi:hypothetical protein
VGKRRAGRLEKIHFLNEDGQYSASEASKAFPDLPIAEIARFIDQRSSLDETSLLRAFRDWVRKKYGTG